MVLYLRAAGLIERLDEEALLVLVVGMLLADDEGLFDEVALFAAVSDPSTMQVARTLIEKASSEV